MPWIHIKSIKTKDTKFGKLIFLEINKYSGGNILAFKFNDQIETFLKELSVNHFTYLENPIFGVDVSNDIINIENEKENLVLY